MIVYVVWDSIFEEVLGVFESKEKAEAFVYNEARRGLCIEDFEVK